MILNPPLRMNGVEVTSVQLAIRSMNVVVSVNANSPMQVQTPEITKFINQQVQSVIRYMELEKFIPEGVGWTVNSAVVMIPT